VVLVHPKIFFGIFSLTLLINYSYTDTRQLSKKQLSLFSVVQFPNEECTSTASSVTTMGTCLTSSECTSRSGTGEGTCAAGFGVCCVVSSSTCGSTVSSNITYIRNPGYPSSYTPTSSGTCSFTIDKASDDICQLRLDFQTMSGYSATTAGACTTSIFEATGQTGKNPPAICGTNTGYHMYVEFGATATDSITLKHTLDTTSKTWNILARQIACTASWKAPTDCVQYFTGISGNVKNYNFGTQLLQSQNYNNCIRQETGYCRIQWQQNSATSPDTFQLDAIANTAATTALVGQAACPIAYVKIPDSSFDGITPLDTGLSPGNAFLSTFCGFTLGTTASIATMSMTSARTPFNLGVWTAAAALTTGQTGFSLDYTQLPC